MGRGRGDDRGMADDGYGPGRALVTFMWGNEVNYTDDIAATMKVRTTSRRGMTPP
jgi:hypothetical protein